MLAIKREYEDIPCCSEYLIASSLIDKNFTDFEDMLGQVMSEFHLQRGQALVILEGRSFYTVLNKLLKAKRVLGEVAVINKLVSIIQTGKPEQMLEAIRMIEYWSNQRKKPNGKKPQQPRSLSEAKYNIKKDEPTMKQIEKEESTEIIVDGVIADSDESIELVEIDDD
jgi:hypothetical protein